MVSFTKASRTLILTSLSLSFLCTTVVNAEPVLRSGADTAEKSEKAIYYRDLDLSLATDQRRLHRRVQDAVEHVCGRAFVSATRMLQASAQYDKCSVAAWDHVRPTMDSAVARAGTRLAAGKDDGASLPIIVMASSGR